MGKFQDVGKTGLGVTFSEIKKMLLRVKFLKLETVTGSRALKI